MKINLAIQCIVLLACMAICTSFGILRCRCLKNMKFVKPSFISDVRVYDPHPYCNRREIIVTLKDGSEWCLNPAGKFTQVLLERMKQVKSGNKTTTVSTPGPVIVSATVSATEVPLQLPFCQKLRASRKYNKKRGLRRRCLGTQWRVWKPRAKRPVSKSNKGGMKGKSQD